MNNNRYTKKSTSHGGFGTSTSTSSSSSATDNIMDVPNMQSSRQTSSNSSGKRNNNNNVINSSFTSRSSRTDSSRSSGSGSGGGSGASNNNRRNSSGRSTKNNRSSRSMVGIEAAQLDVPHLGDDDDDMTHASSSVAAASSADAAAGYPPSLSGVSFASGSHRSVSSSRSGRSSNKKRNSKTKKETSSKSTSAIIIEDEETTSSSYYYNENNIEWGSVTSHNELSDSLNKQQQFDTVNISGNNKRYQATFHNTTSNNDPSSRSRLDTRRSSLDQTLTTIDYNSSSAKSLNLEMPTSSNETNQSRRSSLIFESLWEGTSNLWNSSRSLFATNGNQNDDASYHHHQQGGIKFGTKHTHNLRSNRYNYEEEGGDDDSSFAPTVTSLNSNEECSSKHMQLMRTISGRVAFMRNPSCRIANNSVSDDDSLQGYGMGYNRCTRYTKYIMEHVKFTLLCLIISIAMAVSIGTLIVMIPLWINEDERDVSGELGGLVYAGDGEVTDMSVTDGMKDAKGSLIMSDGSGNNADEQKLEDEAETGDWELGAEAQDLSSSSNNSNHGGGWTNEEKVPVLPSLDIGISSSSSLSSSSSSIRPPTKTFFKPPPYELQDVCSSSSIADPDRYGECVAACLPSRCCLVPETEPYEVWTLPPSWNAKSISSDSPSVIMNTEDTIEDKVTIGTIIPSCFLQNTDLCVTYNHECSILDTSVLLPRKPPTNEEVSKMNNSEKLKLAEWINHSCGKLHMTRSSSEESECQLLCQEKECCFVDDPSSKESSTATPEDTNPTEDTGPNPSFLRHRYRRVIAENNDPEMVYMGIPGEEGFEYAAPKEEEELTSPPEEANQTVVTTKEEMAVVPNEQPIKEETIEIAAQNDVVSTFTKVQEKEHEIIENCVSDPEMFCLTYTGCGPLFDAN